MRQQRYYGPLHETSGEIDEEQAVPGKASEDRTDAARPMRQQRHYGALNETASEVDDQQVAGDRAAGPVRSWTHHGGMVPQQDSAHQWIRQNRESRMAANDRSGSAREGEGAASAQDRAQAQAEIAEARAAVEEARRREAAEQARQQQRDRGPER